MMFCQLAFCSFLLAIVKSSNFEIAFNSDSEVINLEQPDHFTRNQEVSNCPLVNDISSSSQTISKLNEILRKELTFDPLFNPDSEEELTKRMAVMDKTPPKENSVTASMYCDGTMEQSKNYLYFAMAGNLNKNIATISIATDNILDAIFLKFAYELTKIYERELTLPNRDFVKALQIVVLITQSIKILSSEFMIYEIPFASYSNCLYTMQFQSLLFILLVNLYHFTMDSTGKQFVADAINRYSSIHMNIQHPKIIHILIKMLGPIFGIELPLNESLYDCEMISSSLIKLVYSGMHANQHNSSFSYYKNLWQFIISSKNQQTKKNISKFFENLFIKEIVRLGFNVAFIENQESFDLAFLPFKYLFDHFDERKKITENRILTQSELYSISLAIGNLSKFISSFIELTNANKDIIIRVIEEFYRIITIKILFYVADFVKFQEEQNNESMHDSIPTDFLKFMNCIININKYLCFCNEFFPDIDFKNAFPLQITKNNMEETHLLFYLANSIKSIIQNGGFTNQIILLMLLLKSSTWISKTVQGNGKKYSFTVFVEDALAVYHYQGDDIEDKINDFSSTNVAYFNSTFTCQYFYEELWKMNRRERRELLFYYVMYFREIFL